MSQLQVHPRVFVVMNGKGGVGKTSLVSNLGGLYAAAEYRVLLVDFDPQGNLGADLGYGGSDDDDQGEGLFEALTRRQPQRLQPVQGVRANLDVVPGGSVLHDLAAYFAAVHQRTGEGAGPRAGMALASALTPIVKEQAYDLILIDSPPGDEILQTAALVASRWVLIPTRTDASSRQGLRVVADRFAQARQHNPALEPFGVVLFGVTASATRVAAEARASIEAELGEAAPVFPAAIRYAEAAAVDARDRGRLAFELERDAAAQQPWYVNRGQRTRRLASSAGSVAQDYAQLADQFLERLAQVEETAAPGPFTAAISGERA